MEENRFDILLTSEAQRMMNFAIAAAIGRRNEYVTPEHMLLGMFAAENYSDIFGQEAIDTIRRQLTEYIAQLDIRPKDSPSEEIEVSYQMGEVMKYAQLVAESSEKKVIEVSHLVAGLYSLPNSQAHTILEKTLGEDYEVLGLLSAREQTRDMMVVDRMEQTGSEQQLSPYATRIEQYCGGQTTVGREKEIERTMQVVCRCKRNYALLVGEMGVGRLSVAAGVQQMISSGNAPERLKEYDVFVCDMLRLLSGVQMYGMLENRVEKMIYDLSRANERKVLLVIRDIHQYIGTEGANDFSADVLKIIMNMDPETSPEVRIVGTTTYEGMKTMEKNRLLLNQFQTIDIDEPTKEQTLDILREVKGGYESVHKVSYGDDVLRHAIDMSVEHMGEKSLPTKAIDLLDDAGAMIEIARTKRQRAQRKVKASDIDRALLAVCRIKAEALQSDDNSQLMTLESRMKKLIYGQDEAIERLVNCIQMSKAGLLDSEKPIASMLFVGPTGVGKTEVARVLASEMGVELVRFDMSEYVEKHTVAKLIGSPAGYVGYEDGGLLTGAIRKNPNCVLLLDEIEKAHEDIYNILLQIMDYGRLTDNRGNKADFRHVVLIMTSNAGAQFASQASVGFGGGVSEGEAMLTQVKKTFKPEFRNRLSATVVFNSMDSHMAELILDKKLHQLETKLRAKNVTLTLTAKARKAILDKGFTQKMGAREMDRALQQMLVPLLTREILFGKLRKGGEAQIDIDDKKELFIR